MQSVEATAIVGIVVAGVVGPTLGYLARWYSDLRRFQHERDLKASDDLIERLDEVSAALEQLTEAAVELRGEVIRSGTTAPDVLWPLLQQNEDAFQVARSSIVRLEMRAHADAALCGSAMEAAKAFHKPSRTARTALIKARIKYEVAEDYEAMGAIPQMIDDAYESTTAYQAEARRTLAALTLPTPPARSRLRLPSQLG